MIATISDFLEQFKTYALSRIEKEEKDISHRPTIGNIFEGLTAEILDRAIFKDFDLRIVEKSFIYNDNVIISSEMDCMLVVGSGKQILYTQQYKYHIKDVIAVFQVKKNLYTNDIDNSHQNLLSVIKISEPRDAELFVAELHRDAYKLLNSKVFPSKERRERFTDRENIIYHLLLMEAFYPLRIVIGYYGYKDEYSLREGFVNNIEEVCKNGPASGYGLGSFPNMYICGNNTIIKNNGMPIGLPFSDNDFYWDILISSNERPMYYLLQLIWTRLSYKFNISSEIFGDDFHKDAMHPFIACKERKIDEDKWGWEFYYHEMSRSNLSLPLKSIEWAPVEIDTNKYTILSMLSEMGEININTDKDFLQFIATNKLNVNEIINELKSNRLIYIDEDKIGLLVDELIMVFKSDKIYAGENKSGEMNIYFSKYIH